MTVFLGESRMNLEREKGLCFKTEEKNLWKYKKIHF